MIEQLTKPQRTEVIDEQDAIVSVLQLYIAGSAKGDAGKLKEAFHADARMFGSVAGTRMDVPIKVFFELAAKSPADVDGKYRGRILFVHQVGEAATAAIAEDGFWGRLSFVDFFNLAKIDGRWWIVNKAFDHTGGVPPVK